MFNFKIIYLYQYYISVIFILLLLHSENYKKSYYMNLRFFHNNFKKRFNIFFIFFY